MCVYVSCIFSFYLFDVFVLFLSFFLFFFAERTPVQCKSLRKGSVWMDKWLSC